MFLESANWGGVQHHAVKVLKKPKNLPIKVTLLSLIAGNSFCLEIRSLF